MDWKLWLKGLLAAVIGGSANSVLLVIVDPTTYNLTEGLYSLIKVIATTAIVSAAMYLKQSPIPKDCDEA